MVWWLACTELKVCGSRPNPCHCVVSSDSKLCHIISLHPCLYMYLPHTCTAGLGMTLRWTSILSSGGVHVATLSVGACYRFWDKLQPCRPPEGLEYTVEYTCTLYGGLCIVSCCVGGGGELVLSTYDCDFVQQTLKYPL